MSDDDMSDDMSDAAHEDQPPAGEEAAAPDKKSVLKTQVAYCRAKLQELKKLKTDLLKDEDFLGAKDAKEKLRKQEEEIETLRNDHLESIPAPLRKRMRSKIADPLAQMEEQNPPGAVKKEDGMDVENEWHVASSSQMATLRDIDCDEERPFSIPKKIYERLYDYQRIGVAWMAKLWQKDQGGILADEMGLGKTIQICALLNGVRKSGATHALLLLPVTLLAQWSHEAKIWCPGWPVYCYYGSKSQKDRALQKIRRPAGGILLTSYSILGQTDCLFEVPIEQDEPSRKKRRKLDSDGNQCKDSDDEEAKEIELPVGGLPQIGEKRPWDVVVCDEAHRMKNIGTLLGKSLRHLRSKSRFLLTGTPVQNAMQDLWALMDFAQPGLLGNHTTFVKRFSDPIDAGSVRGADPFQAELKKCLATQLRSLIRPHVLRRTKVGTGLVGDALEIEVQDRLAEMDEIFGGPDKETEEKDNECNDAQVKKLPPKLETIVWLMPTSEQLSVYQKILEKSDIIRQAEEKTKLGLDVFRAINMLKRLCNHPALLLPCPKAGQWADFLADATGPQQDAGNDAEALIQGEVAENPSTPAPGEAPVETDDARCRAAETFIRKLPRTAEDLLQQSAKLRCVSSLIPTLVAKGHRILVFSHSLKMLDLVQICCLQPANIRCLRIDGQTDPVARAGKVRKFQQQPDRFQCMLLTTNVGGVGLNLTSADRVILMDPAWNPSVDAQAVDRAFRIGQEREVRVYRLIMSGLIEDKMFRLQVFKMGITRTALEGGQSHSYFTAREIRALFEWTDPAEGATRKLLEEKHGTDADATVHEAAANDGGKDGWLDMGPAVGLSDLTLVFGSCNSCIKEELPVRQDITATEKITQAKEKLDEVDKKLQEKKAAREAAEAQVDEMRCELDAAIAGIEQSKEQRLKGEETLKELRSKSSLSRKAAAHAKQLYDRANRTRLTGTEQRINATQNVSQFEKITSSAEKVFEEACSNVRSEEQTLGKAIDECELHARGSADFFDVVSAPRTMTSLVKESLKTLRKHLDAMAIQQAEVECANDGLAWADKGLSEAEASLAGMGGKDRPAEEQVESWSQEQRKAEAAHEKTQDRAEEAWEETKEVVASFVESGVSFAESLSGKKASVMASQVKASQHACKLAFRQVSSAFIAVRRAREALAKATAQRRKAMQKSFSALSSLKLAAHKTASAECEYACASTQEETCRADLDAIESQVGAVETQREGAEALEAQLKKRKEELKAAIPLAKEAIKVARTAEKEVFAERQTVQAQCSKVERAHLKMDDLINSALQKLKSEEYNTRQHEIAYDGIKRKVSSISLHLPDCKEAAAAAAKSYEEACNVARSTEERLSEAFKACQLPLSFVDEEGRASGEAVVDVPVDKLRPVTTAMDKLQTSLDDMAIRQAELECADEDLQESYSRLTEAAVALGAAVNRARCASGSGDKAEIISSEKNRRAADKARKGCEKVNQHALEFQAKAQQAAEAAWEEMSKGVEDSLKAGIAFAEALEPSEAKNPLMGAVNAAQNAARRSFRQVSSAAIAVRNARTGWVKAARQRTNRVQKEAAAMVAHAEAGSLVEASPH